MNLICVLKKKILEYSIRIKHLFFIFNCDVYYNSLNLIIHYFLTL